MYHPEGSLTKIHSFINFVSAFMVLYNEGYVIVFALSLIKVLKTLQYFLYYLSFMASKTKTKKYLYQYSLNT